MVTAATASASTAMAEGPFAMSSDGQFNNVKVKVVGMLNYGHFGCCRGQQINMAHSLINA